MSQHGALPAAGAPRRPPGRSVGPSTPQFQLSFWSVPVAVACSSPRCAAPVTRQVREGEPVCTATKLIAPEGRRPLREQVGGTGRPGAISPGAARRAPPRTVVRRRGTCPFHSTSRAGTRQLVPARADVPWFGDELTAASIGSWSSARRRRIPDRTRSPRGRASSRGRSGTRRHGRRSPPITQRLHHHLQYTWMRQVQRVAGAGVVHVAARVAGLEPVASWCRICCGW